MTPKTETIREKFLDANFACVVWDVVEIAAVLNILIHKVDRRVENAALEAHGTGDGLDTPASSQ